MKDFSRLGPLQAVTYTVKVVVSKKWRKVDRHCYYTPLIVGIIWFTYLCHFQPNPIQPMVNSFVCMSEWLCRLIVSAPGMDGWME